MRKILSVLAIIVLFANCKKSSDSGDNTGGTANSYHPLTTGSNWTYTDNPGGTYTLTVSNKDTVALGRTYKVLSSSTGGSVYETASGNDHFRFSTFNGALPNGVEELYLKDNVAVNATWSVSTTVNYSGQNLPVTLKYTVKEKDITKTVQGKTYTSSVVHIRLDASVTIPFLGSQSLDGGDFFYAKGVGRISHSLNLGNATLGLTPFNQTSELVNYQIK